jgi:ubiquinone/menaquinone biosynthesis C-methylase UbiE
MLEKDKIITFILNYLFRRDKEWDEKLYWDKFWKDKIFSGKFSELEYWFQVKVYRRMHNYFLSILGDLSGKKILEVGCGSGYASLLLSEAGAFCTLMDSSEGALKYSENLLQKIGVNKNKINYVLGSAEKIPFKDNSFDIVHNCGVLEHYNDEQIKRILFEMKRVTKRGGQVIVVLPNLLSLEIIYRMFKFGKGSEQYISKRKLKKFLEEVGLVNIEIKSAHASVLPSFIPQIIHDRFSWIDDIFTWGDYLFYGRGFKE